MADYDVSRKDVEEAAELLRDYLTARIAQGDFTQDGVLGQLLVDGHASIVALLRKELAVLKSRQSVRKIRQLPESQGAADAADDLLSNVFLGRSPGTFARGPATLHFTQRADALIPRSTRFFRTESHVFYIDSASDYLISAGDLTPVADASGQVATWAASRIPLVAARVGSDYNLAPDRFLDVDRFSPYFAYVEHTASFQDGDGTQTTASVLDGAKDALALRALINPRSNSAVMREQFPELPEVLTIGYGDPEMMRDLLQEAAVGMEIHLGGATDLFVRLPVQEVTERLVIGASRARADNLVTIFKDPSVDFVALGVVSGDVLTVSEGLPNSPTQVRIITVRTNEVEVSTRSRFKEATDEYESAPTFTYSIGNNYPLFDNKLAVPSTSTASTSRLLSVEQGVILAGAPCYRVTRVQVMNPPLSLSPYLDAGTNTLLFTSRANALPSVTPTAGDPLSYVVEVLNPGSAQSARSVTTLKVGWPAVDLSGLTLEVTYDSVAGFEAIDSYVSAPSQRVNGADVLARAAHPVYVSFTVPYRLRTVVRRVNGRDLVTLAPFDETTAARGLVAYVASFRDSNVLDAPLLATQARQQASASIAAVFPFEASYELLAPDGQVYRYSSPDLLTVFPTSSGAARLLNPAELGLPTTGYHAALKAQLLALGVSDRTTRYACVEGAVSYDLRT